MKSCAFLKNKKTKKKYGAPKPHYNKIRLLFLVEIHQVHGTTQYGIREFGMERLPTKQLQLGYHRSVDVFCGS